MAQNLGARQSAIPSKASKFRSGCLNSFASASVSAFLLRANAPPLRRATVASAPKVHASSEGDAASVAGKAASGEQAIRFRAILPQWRHLSDAATSVARVDKGRLYQNGRRRAASETLSERSMSDNAAVLNMQAKLAQREKQVVNLERRIGNLQKVLQIADRTQPRKAASTYLLLDAALSDYSKLRRMELTKLFSVNDWAAVDQEMAAANDPFEVLESLRLAFSDWIAKYHALLDVIEARGYTIRSVQDYLTHGLQPSTVTLYHDVHAWDIIAALGMVLANKDRGISSSFYLNVAHAPVDVVMEPAYRCLARLDGRWARIGLHAAPFSSWLRMEVFEGDDGAFMKWAGSDQAGDDLNRLVADNDGVAFGRYTLEDAKVGTRERFRHNYDQLRKMAPAAVSANHHGDEVSTLTRQISAPHRLANPFLSAFHYMMGPEADGVEISPGYIQHTFWPDGRIYNENVNKAAYFQNLYDMLAGDTPILLLNHPSVLSNDLIHYDQDFAKTVKDKAASIRAKNFTKAEAGPAPAIDLAKGIYISGYARGGTTWLRNIVSSHGDVFEIPTQVALWARNRDLITTDFVTEKIKTMAAEFPGAWSEIQNAPRFALKAPVNSETLPHLLPLLPDGRFLHIIRDPRDVLISYQRTGADWTDALSAFDVAMGRTERFHACFEEAKGDPALAWVRYEDLHQQFPRTAAQIFEHLNLDASDEMIKAIMAAVSFRAQRGGAHRERRGKMRRGVVGDWTKHLGFADAERFRESSFWGKMFEDYGYNWITTSLASQLQAARAAGVDSKTEGESGAGLHVLACLSGADWSFPVNIAERLGYNLANLGDLGMAATLAVGERIPTPALPHLKPHLEGEALALEINLDALPAEVARAKSRIQSLIANYRVTRRVLGSVGTEKAYIFGESKTSAEMAKAALAAAGIAAHSLAETGFLKQDPDGVLTAFGLPAAFDLRDSGSWSALRHAPIFAIARPTALALNAPLGLGFRSDFG